MSKTNTEKNKTDKENSVEKKKELRVIKQYPDKEGRVIRFYGVKEKGKKEYFRVFRINKEVEDNIETKEEAEEIFEKFLNLEM